MTESTDWFIAGISALSAMVAVGAAAFAAQQAGAAKRQADAAHGDVDPTFHIEREPSTGQSPWRFVLKANNFNRRAIVLSEIRIDPGENFVVYDTSTALHSIVRTVVAAQDVAKFDLTRNAGNVIAGIAPNSGTPSILSREFGLGLRTNAVAPANIDLRIEIDWRYIDETTLRNAAIKDSLPTAEDQR